MSTIAASLLEKDRASAGRIAWYPQPKQHALISCPVEDVLYGGA
jgi:hypothetical protein